MEDEITNPRGTSSCVNGEMAISGNHPRSDRPALSGIRVCCLLAAIRKREVVGILTYPYVLRTKGVPKALYAAWSELSSPLTAL